jgi:lipopolysaccharide transport system permease protein
METIIQPQKRLRINFTELWRYRELFYFFAWRDFKVRYKQTFIGAGWAIIQPFATMVVFTIFFNKIAGIESGAIPYAIFSYSGLIFWNYFANTLGLVSNSLLSNAGVLTKIYFPRIIVPASSTLLGLADFFFAGIVLAGLMIYFGFAPQLSGILMLLPMLLLAMATAFGAGTFFAALNVKYRDVRAIVPFLIQILLFLTPVIYPVSLVPQKYQWVLYLNPMTGVISTMRAGLLSEGSINWAGIGISTAVALTLLVTGVLYFRRTERRFADII